MAGNAMEHPLLTNVRPGTAATFRDIHGHPEMHVTIGRDARSSGFTIEIWVPAPNNQTRRHILYAARWGAPLGTVEELMQLAYNGITAALGELLGEPLTLD